MGKEWSFQQMIIGPLGSHRQKNEVGPLLHTTDKNQLKMGIMWYVNYIPISLLLNKNKQFPYIEHHNAQREIKILCRLSTFGH